MAANSKSGLSKFERDKFMYDHGFVPLPNRGKGDHTVWDHAGIRELAKKQAVNCPPNLLHNVAQPAWQHTVPDNPATGTWHRIAKHAEWCQETLAALSGASADEQRRRKAKQEFLEARQDICDWKRDVKHRLRAGLDTRPAPAAYHQINTLRAQF
jgi:hypothetical protein